MATYLDLIAVIRDSDLQDKVIVAVEVAAITIMNEVDTTPNHANRLIWAGQALDSPKSKSDGMLNAVVALNKDFTVAQILGASDSSIQANVDSAVDLFADGT